MSKEKNSANFAIGILIGVIGGVAAGVLLAPKEGKKTLEDIKEVIGEIKERISPELIKSKEKAIQLIESTKYKIELECKKIGDEYKAKKLAEAKNKEHDIYCL